MPGRSRTRFSRVHRACIVALVCVAAVVAADAAPVRLATFNVQNYLCMDRRLEGRFRPKYPKPEKEKAAIRSVIRAVHPHVLCLQEIGPRPFLDELQQDLATEGSPFPHAAFLEAADPLRHVALVARIPIRAVVEHDDVTFEYLGRTEPVKRGLLEVTFDGEGGVWRVFIVHLKSPLTEHAADPGAEKRRAAEARAVRDRILRQTRGETEPRFVIAGDLNDAPDSRTLAAFSRRKGKVAAPLEAADSRGEVWTHFQARSARYERVDYILVSPGLLPHVVGRHAFIFDGERAIEGSDHRLVWTDLEIAVDASPAVTPAPATKTPAGTSRPAL